MPKARVKEQISKELYDSDLTGTLEEVFEHLEKVAAKMLATMIVNKEDDVYLSEPKVVATPTYSGTIYELVISYERNETEEEENNRLKKVNAKREKDLKQLAKLKAMYESEKNNEPSSKKKPTV